MCQGGGDRIDRFAAEVPIENGRVEVLSGNALDRCPATGCRIADLGARVVECDRHEWEQQVRSLLTDESVGHLVTLRSDRSPLRELLSPSLATRLAHLAGDANLHLVAPEDEGR